LLRKRETQCRPGEDGDELIGVSREGVTDALPDAVEAAQDTVAGSFPHCYPLLGSSSLHSTTGNGKLQSTEKSIQNQQLKSYP
jgi:hypothetical protein